MVHVHRSESLRGGRNCTALTIPSRVGHVPEAQPQGGCAFPNEVLLEGVPMQSASAWQHDPLLSPSAVRDRDDIARTPWLKDATFDILLLVASVVIVPAVLLAMWCGV